MSMPAKWVDEIFGRLTIRYGHLFLGRWSGLDLAAVKADWAHMLGGMSPDEVRNALDSLPPDQPPTVIKFRELGRIRDDSQQLRLPAPDPAGIRRIASALAGVSVGGVTPAEIRVRLQAKVKAGIASPAQRDFLRRLEIGDSSGDAQVVSGTAEIPEHLLPPGMRGVATEAIEA